MYYNVFGEKVSRARYREMLTAAKNRREVFQPAPRDVLEALLATKGEQPDEAPVFSEIPLTRSSGARHALPDEAACDKRHPLAPTPNADRLGVR